MALPFELHYDIKGVDKKNFQSFKFPDGSYYYGEIKWFDENGNMCDEPNEDETLSDPTKFANLTKLRHGNGVQLVIRLDTTMLWKYEGEWVKGEKCGLCNILYSDGSQYSGKVINNGVKEFVNGIFLWPNGDVYEGSFKDDRMDGIGHFTPFSKKDGKKEGVFRNNYYHIGGKRYVNPFHSDEESEKNLDTADNLKKIQKKGENKFSFETVKTFHLMREWIDKSNANGRVPLIIATKLSQLRFTNVKEQFSQMGFVVKKFDLRKAWQSLQDGFLQDYYQHVKKILAECMVKGHYFFVNIDEFDSKSLDGKYDPDFKEFYNKDFFPSQIFEKKYLHVPEVYKHVLKDTEWEGQKIHPNFKIAVWSKYKVEDGLDKNKMKDQIERRFSILLEMPKIDMIIFRLSQNTMMMSKTGSRLGANDGQFLQRKSINELSVQNSTEKERNSSRGLEVPQS